MDSMGAAGIPSAPVAASPYLGLYAGGKGRKPAEYGRKRRMGSADASGGDELLIQFIRLPKFIIPDPVFAQVRSDSQKPGFFMILTFFLLPGEEITSYPACFT